MKGSDCIGHLLEPNIRTFYVLSRTFSYKETANLLHLSEATASRRISSLENQLGVTLVSRSTRPVKLTPDGKSLAEQLRMHMRPLWESLESLQKRNNVKPELRIGFVESLSLDAAPLLLKALQPLLSSELCLTGTSDHLLHALLTESLDVIVSSDPYWDRKDLRRRFLFGEPSVLMMPQQMAKRHDGPWTWEDLRFCGLPYIRYYRESGGGKLSDAFLSSIGLELSSTVEVDTNGLMLSLIALGAGWTLTRTTSLLQHRNLAPKVAVRPMPAPMMHREIYLIDRMGISALLQDRIAQELNEIFRTKIGPRLAQIAPWIRSNLLVSLSTRGLGKRRLFSEHEAADTPEVQTK